MAEGVDLQLTVPNGGGGEKNTKKRSFDEINENNHNQHTIKKLSRTYETVFYEDKYDNTNMEYFVLLDLVLEEKEENMRKKINEVKIYEILETAELHNGLIRIKRIGFRRAKVLFRSASQANLVISKKDELAKSHLRPFIPSNFVYKYGIIYDVPKSLSESRIKENLISDVKIKDVTRMTRYDSKAEESYNTNTIKVTFYGNELPETVILFYSINKVHLYVPKQCFRCGRLGHTKINCKASKLRCLNCSSDLNNGNCNPPCEPSRIKCLLCGLTDHNCLSNYKKCPKKQEQATANKVMAIGNLSFSEFKEKYGYKNSYEILTDQEYELNFPELSNNRKKTQNNQEIINKTLMKAQFNEVVQFKSKPRKFNQPKYTPPIQGTANDVESVSAFSLPLEKVNDIDRFMNTFVSNMLKTAEENASEELINKLKQLKKNMNYVTILCDELQIKSSINNG